MEEKSRLNVQNCQFFNNSALEEAGLFVESVKVQFIQNTACFQVIVQVMGVLSTLKT